MLLLQSLDFTKKIPIADRSRKDLRICLAALLECYSALVAGMQCITIIIIIPDLPIAAAAATKSLAYYWALQPTPCFKVSGLTQDRYLVA